MSEGTPLAQNRKGCWYSICELLWTYIRNLILDCVLTKNVLVKGTKGKRWEDSGLLTMNHRKEIL